MTAAMIIIKHDGVACHVAYQNELNSESIKHNGVNVGEKKMANGVAIIIINIAAAAAASEAIIWRQQIKIMK